MRPLFSITIALFLCCTSLNAQNRNTGTQKIEAPVGIISLQDLERQREEAKEIIAITSQLLKEASASAKSSLNRLNLLSQQLMSRRKIISLLGQEITTIDRRIKTMNDEIEVLDKDLTKSKENYAKSMQNQQQEHRTAQYRMLLILSAEDLAQSYRRMRYLREYSDWQKEEAGRIIKKQEEITARKAELEKTRDEKQTLLAQRENENKKLKNEEQLQQKEVKDLDKKRNELQKQLQQKRKEADDLNKHIENFIAEEIKKSAEANTAESDTTTTLTEAARPATPQGSSYILTESESTISKSFTSSKGKLPAPLTKQYTIVSDFGEHQHQELSLVRTVNNGIDMQTTAGTEAKAIYKGVITRVFVMPGFNNNVIIRHGDYLTVYSNLSEVYIKAGDAVDTHQLIGKIYTDPEKNNETILHFQIWHERTKLNPAVWIK